MNAIDLLNSRHRSVEKVFSQIEGATAAAKKKELCNEIIDSLAAHAAIEETSILSGGESQADGTRGYNQALPQCSESRPPR